MPPHPFPQPLTALRYSRAMQVPLFEPYRWGRTEDWTVARAFVMAVRGVGMRARSAAAPRLPRSNVKRCIKHLSTTLPCATNPPPRSSRRSRRSGMAGLAGYPRTSPALDALRPRASPVVVTIAAEGAAATAHCSPPTPTAPSGPAQALHSSQVRAAQRPKVSS